MKVVGNSQLGIRGNHAAGGKRMQCTIMVLRIVVANIYVGA